MMNLMVMYTLRVERSGAVWRVLAYQVQLFSFCHRERSENESHRSLAILAQRRLLERLPAVKPTWNASAQRGEATGKQIEPVKVQKTKAVCLQVERGQEGAMDVVGLSGVACGECDASCCSFPTTEGRLRPKFI
jgi:hypothetical protein